MVNHITTLLKLVKKMLMIGLTSIMKEDYQKHYQDKL